MSPVLDPFDLFKQLILVFLEWLEDMSEDCSQEAKRVTAYAIPHEPPKIIWLVQIKLNGPSSEHFEMKPSLLR